MRRLSMIMIAAMLGCSTSAHAATLAPVKGSQLVTVLANGACPIPGYTGSNSFLFTQMVKADGSTVLLTIPPKQILVITDVTISASNEPAGDSMLSLVAVGTAAFGNAIAGRFDTTATGGTVTAEFQFPAGVAVKSTSSACAEMLNLTHGGFVGLTAIAHGFFAPDK